jgi:hypothetical protein
LLLIPIWKRTVGREDHFKSCHFLPPPFSLLTSR